MSEGPGDAQVRYTYGRAWPGYAPLLPASFRLCRAWAVMLAEQRLIDPGRASALIDAIDELEGLGHESFPFDAHAGDVYVNVQAFVIDRLGTDVGGAIYMGRSRVDTNMTVLRLFIRDELVQVLDALSELVDTLLARAREHADTVMAGYSGAGAAQPWTLGHYFAAFADAFARDLDRVEHGYDAANTSLAGAGTGSGSDLDLDRGLVAELLGCRDVVENAGEFGTSTDAVLESASACVILLTHLSQLTSDLSMWTTQELGLADLTDALSGSSSFMPHKRNPVPLGTIRPVTAGAVGQLMSMLSVLRTTSWSFDRTELVPPSITLLRDTRDMVAYMSATIEGLVVNETVMRQRALEQWTTGGEIARLVEDRGELDWRSSHWVAGRFIRLAIERGLTPSTVTAELLDEAAIAVLGRHLVVSTAELRAVLDPDRFVQTRRTQGSVNPAEVKRMISRQTETQTAFKRRHEMRHDALDSADRKLAERIAGLRARS